MAAVDAPLTGSDLTAADADEGIYPCKGCGEILEEGKAFELAGNRWHINCFRCNTCGTLLDSDANLLLLGDGSLICNNCTYSCSACGNKIEDLAILTGNEAFCASCFKCRNCKKKIDNLRYARTSQGIFCMQCHESLMARRRKKSKQSSQQRPQPSRDASTGSGPAGLEKSLPALPPTNINTSQPAPGELESPASGSLYSITPTADSAAASGHLRSRKDAGYVDLNQAAAARDGSDSSPAPSATLPQSPTSADGFDIPIAFQMDHPSNSNLSPANARVGNADGFKSEDFKDLVAGSSISRSHSKDRSNRAGVYSPHIAYQEKGRQASAEQTEPPPPRKAPTRDGQPSEPVSHSVAGGSERHRTQPSQSSEYSNNSAFKLQEAPKDRGSKGSTSAKGSPNMSLSAHTETSPAVEQGVYSSTDNEAQLPRRKNSFRRSPLAMSDSYDQALPGRTDSQKAPNKQGVSRKEVGRTDDEFEDVMRKVQGRKLSAGEAAPMALDVVREPPPRSSSRPNANRPTEEDGSFTTPREAPAPPGVQAFQLHKPNASASSIQSEHLQPKDPASPLPLYSATGEFSMDDELGRIIRGDTESPGLFRRVSKAVKHSRTQSDKALQPGQSPKHWRANSKNGSMDISSPIIQKSDLDDDASVLKTKLWEAQRKIAELEADKLTLNDKINGTEEIRQANSELREKRSTMAFLDSQREMVVRELEVMTDHLARAKESNKPINLEELKIEACADLVRSLKKLEEGLGTQIEELIKRKNELLADLSNLVRMKDKGMAEYESLETKNNQLMQLHESLVQNIQTMYQQGKAAKPSPNGLGISAGSPDWRPRLDSISDARSAVSTEAGASQFSGETVIESEPKVVDIRKGAQAKKFNWKRGGQTMGKNISRGLKGAFGGVQNVPLRDDNFAEGVPYGSIEAGEAPVVGNVPARMLDKDRRNWNFPNQSQPAKSAKETRDQPLTGLPADSSLFGSDLSARADYERRVIPAIVTRCIEEVESRGMDVEGVYRKSGSSSQVRTIQQGFEKDFAAYSISDPDLDIHAITSAVKQYLRKLPLPLITYEAYDALVDAADMPDGSEKVFTFVKIVEALPSTHRDTLEFLLGHLARIMKRERVNLMTTTNLAVVFAPTIMRPRAAERELADMEHSRAAIEYLIRNQTHIF